MQRLYVSSPRILVVLLAVATFFTRTTHVNAQVCSDQECDYTISIVPVLDITDDSNLPITSWLDTTVTNSCS